MKTKSLGFLFPLITLILLVMVFNQSIGLMPPVGTFFNPFTGVVQNEKTNKENRSLDMKDKDFEITFDKRMVPHVFAKKSEDLYFAQGYVTASDRLWQMDFVSIVSAGRLSEIFGEPYLEYDRSQRRGGILWSAERTLKFMESDSETKKVLDSYTAGVNAWIEQLSQNELPVEYKLIGYKPEKWSNLKSVLVMKYVATILTGYEEDYASTHMLLALGEEEYRKIYPEYSLKDVDFDLGITGLLDSIPYKDYIDYSFLSRSPASMASNYNPRLGSNSWAVSGDKTKSGNAILCNDPHLNLTYPSIWYEVQLSDDKMNVYGVSIPGTPGVIIGYNDHISWGVTNGSTDVRDWYKVELAENYSHYKIDGVQKKTKKRIETIEVKGTKTFYDTIYFTEHGPIMYDDKFNPLGQMKNHALKWTLHEPSNEFLAFIKLNRSENYVDFSEAISNYKSPVQNFTYADVKGNIGLRHQGRIYKKWQGQGKFILDGSTSEHSYSEELETELPATYNPESGFVYSANNNPFGRDNSFYNYGYYSELRADKIKGELSQRDDFTIQKMKQMQLDNRNHFTELALPVLLDIIGKEHKHYKELSNWNCAYEKESTTAVLFEDWWNAIESKTWDELSRYPFFIRYPDDLVLLNLIRSEKNSKYFDVLGTTKIESASTIIKSALKEVSRNQNGTNWGKRNNVAITHLANIPQLGEQGLEIGGHPDALNALSSNFGPSWRMIVEMGKTPVAYGICLGGQSGNPASAFFDSGTAVWKRGAYFKLERYQSLQKAKAGALYTWKSK